MTYFTLGERSLPKSGILFFFFFFGGSFQGGSFHRDPFC